MGKFEKLTEIRDTWNLESGTLSNVAMIDTEDKADNCLHVLWAYPDVLNLHGGRGDMMALLHVSNLLELPVEIRRVNNLGEDLPFDWAHMVCLNSGELKCAPEVTSALQRQKKQLDEFLVRGGMIWAIASSGAVLAKKTVLLDGGTFAGLGLLDMEWKERVSVWGDDLWFTTPEGLEVMGNQIQVADVRLAEGQGALGKIIYGRGNCDDGKEGARSGNVIFTNCLGPLMVKNPRLTAQWLGEAAESAGIETAGSIADEDIEMEDKSFALIKKFVEGKTGAGNKNDN